MTTTTEPPVIIGDATTAGSRARSRWRRARWPLSVVGILLLAVAFLAVSRPPSSGVAYAPDNADENGARAVARVLGSRGVDVTYVRSVEDAVQAAGPGDTLLITPNPSVFATEQVDALSGTEADLVLLAPEFELLSAATDAGVDNYPSWEAGVYEPGCDAEVAEATGPLALQTGLETSAESVVLCWVSADGVGAYARVEQNRRSVTVIHDGTLLRNDTVLEEGNAALALWSLGENERLVWMVPDPFDLSTGQEDPEAATQLSVVLPPGSGPAAGLLLLVAAFLALWRGRRLGPLVTEDLPVLVRSAETTRGRGRLYRASRARGHAAAGLRAAAADRIAKRLGLARSSDAATVVDAVVAATNRPTEQVAHLLYGPPPADDAALTELARHLDTLESEVHRP